ncbi:2-phospho-L-lactate guanylyltransferase [Knoellia remsis]|uniref:2-phospho-L-lactate guanylyltransferase n=1 Tax=Knoellia remsis TaxID=407159 RepID=A0A2T0UTT4_9MICO|nr:2-phospho-L-lactate guanylyltransferase [Knoellia remsis]PRY61341.1 2-phospho-L-lactate guanylyltransferase [Knoellia remsis]
MQAQRDTGWFVVVPVKGGTGAKSRLRTAVDDPAVVRAITHDTLAVAAEVVGADRVVVVTSDPDETSYAVSSGLVVAPDPGRGLDAAASAGVERARSLGATSVAVLLGDHPALARAELREALEASGRHTSAFVPDADGTGTALVAVTAAGEARFAFGPGSAARHEALGHVRLDLDLAGLRHDVDDAASLRVAIRDLDLGPRTRTALGR